LAGMWIGSHFFWRAGRLGTDCRVLSGCLDKHYLDILASAW
jgi:hypothetical protein